MTFLTKPFVKCLRSEKVVYSSRGWERGMRSYERPKRRGNTLREEQWGCRKLLERVYLPPRIEYSVVNLFVALMKR